MSNTFVLEHGKSHFMIHFNFNQCLNIFKDISIYLSISEIFNLEALYDIASQLRNDWKRVAKGLGYDQPQIRIFETTSGHPHEGAYSMLKTYRLTIFRRNYEILRMLWF